jgi:hypothetical protein
MTFERLSNLFKNNIQQFFQRRRKGGVCDLGHEMTLPQYPPGFFQTDKY